MKILLFAFFILLFGAIAEAQAENCPLDWHEPPCGPPPIRNRDKQIAQALQEPLENTRIVMIMWGGASCPFTFVPGLTVPAGLNCAGSIIGGAAAEITIWYSKKFINDPWDWAYAYSYDGRRRSYEELGIQNLDGIHWTIDNLAYHIQTLDFLGDVIAVSYDRYETCNALALGLCSAMHSQRISEGLTEFGLVLQAMGANFSYLADELDQHVGSGVNPDFVYDFDVLAAWLGWGGRGFQSR